MDKYAKLWDENEKLLQSLRIRLQLTDNAREKRSIENQIVKCLEKKVRIATAEDLEHAGHSEDGDLK